MKDKLITVFLTESSQHELEEIKCRRIQIEHGHLLCSGTKDNFYQMVRRIIITPELTFDYLQ